MLDDPGARYPLDLKFEADGHMAFAPHPLHLILSPPPSHDNHEIRLILNKGEEAPADASLKLSFEIGYGA